LKKRNATANLTNRKIRGKKKAEKLSQFVGPTSTYEKQPFRRAQTLIQKQCQLKKGKNIGGNYIVCNNLVGIVELIPRKLGCYLPNSLFYRYQIVNAIYPQINFAETKQEYYC
jgi:hypothetical protein